MMIYLGHSKTLRDYEHWDAKFFVTLHNLQLESCNVKPIFFFWMLQFYEGQSGSHLWLAHKITFWFSKFHPSPGKCFRSCILDLRATLIELNFHLSTTTLLSSLLKVFWSWFQQYLVFHFSQRFLEEYYVFNLSLSPSPPSSIFFLLSGFTSSFIVKQ